MYVALKSDLFVNTKCVARIMNIDSRCMPCRAVRLEPVTADHDCNTKTATSETNVNVHIEGITEFFCQCTDFILFIADEII